jgi:hypothetical protein
MGFSILYHRVRRVFTRSTLCSLCLLCVLCGYCIFNHRVRRVFTRYSQCSLRFCIFKPQRSQSFLTTEVAEALNIDLGFRVFYHGGRIVFSPCSLCLLYALCGLVF